MTERDHMFKINYRITYTEENISAMTAECFHDIEGFFQIVLNNNEYGHCHGNPLRSGEEGWHWLIVWFTSFLQAGLKLKTSNYIIINDIESYNTWIELRRFDKNLNVNVIRAEKTNENSLVSTRELNNIEEYLWDENNSVLLKDFTNEIVVKSAQFIEEIKSINSSLIKSNNFVNLLKLLDTIKGKK